MIKEHTVQGSEETCYHDIEIQQTVHGLILKSGSYTLNKNKKFELTEPLNLDFTVPEERTHYQLILLENSLAILERKDDELFQDIEGRVDLLAYFTFEPEYNSFLYVDVNFVKVELPYENS